MTTVQINVRVDPALKKAIDDYCRSRGIVINHFVQEALIDRLEELEDIEDLKAIRHEPTRPLRRSARRARARWLATRSRSPGPQKSS